MEDGQALRWFWREPVQEADSLIGFATRPACEADAATRGYAPEEEAPLMISCSR